MDTNLYHHRKAFKYFGMALFVLLPFVSFLIGYQYEGAFVDTADPRTRIFTTQQDCENFTDRTCIPTLCEQNPQHTTCAANNQKGWFATRQPLSIISTTTTPESTMPAGSTPQQVCNNFGGTWISEFNECEGLNQTQCNEAGGTFNECASACRHNPDPNTVCIQICIPVCKF